MRKGRELGRWVSTLLLTVAGNAYTFAVLAQKYLKTKNLGEAVLPRGQITQPCEQTMSGSGELNRRPYES